MLVLGLGVRTMVRGRIGVGVRDVKGTKLLGTKRLGYEVSESLFFDDFWQARVILKSERQTSLWLGHCWLSQKCK